MTALGLEKIVPWCIKEKKGTNLSQNFVNVEMLLSYPIGKLVELIHKVSNVDTAHGVRLGKRHRLRESLPDPSSQKPRNKTRSKKVLLQGLTSLEIRLLPLQASRLPQLAQTLRGH